MRGFDVEAVMAQHAYQHGPALGQFCSCGEVGHPNPELLLSMQDWHRSHAAAIVREAVAEWLTGSPVAASAAEIGVHAIEGCEADPSVEQYALSVLSALAEAVRHD